MIGSKNDSYDQIQGNKLKNLYTVPARNIVNADYGSGEYGEGGGGGATVGAPRGCKTRFSRHEISG